MKILSQNFEDNEIIPERFSCNGQNINPQLYFEDIPQTAKSLALILEDPDAPGGTWTHWTVWNIDPETHDIAQAAMPEGAIEGITSGGGQGYEGPCPPPGSSHRYVFNLYALDTTLDLGRDTEAEDLRAEMEGHIIDEARLTGIYQR